MLLILLFVSLILADPLQSATIYLRYLNNTDLMTGTDSCSINSYKCLDDDSICQKCEITSRTIFRVNGTNGSFVFLEIYTKDPMITKRETLFRYGYAFYSYYIVNARIDKFGKEFLVTSSSIQFTDGTSDKSANFVELNLILGFEA